jgi:uncharacterized protein (DUF2141 family)
MRRNSPDDPKGSCVDSVCRVLLAVFSSGGRAATDDQGGIRSDGGELLIGLYADPDGLGKEPLPMRPRAGLQPIRAGSGAGAQRAVVARCRLGRYAAVMLHDENDDGRLDENEMGLEQ